MGNAHPEAWEPRRRPSFHPNWFFINRICQKVVKSKQEWKLVSICSCYGRVSSSGDESDQQGEPMLQSVPLNRERWRRLDETEPVKDQMMENLSCSQQVPLMFSLILSRFKHLNSNFWPTLTFFFSYFLFLLWPGCAHVNGWNIKMFYPL